MRSKPIRSKWTNKRMEQETSDWNQIVELKKTLSKLHIVLENRFRKSCAIVVTSNKVNIYFHSTNLIKKRRNITGAPTIFIRVGSHGLKVDIHVWDDTLSHLNIPFWTMPDKNLRSNSQVYLCLNSDCHQTLVLAFCLELAIHIRWDNWLFLSKQVHSNKEWDG